MAIITATLAIGLIAAVVAVAFARDASSETHSIGCYAYLAGTWAGQLRNPMGPRRSSAPRASAPR